MALKKTARLPKLGMRNIKSGLAVTICMLLYYLFSLIKFPSNSIIVTQYDNKAIEHTLYACVAAIIVMQGSMESSWKQGKARILGSVLGGLFGLLFLWIDSNILARSLTILFSGLGVILLIYICNLLGIRESSTITCVVFLIIFVTIGSHNPYIYAVNRVIDTTVGSFISIAVNAVIKNPDRKESLTDPCEEHSTSDDKEGRAHEN